MKRKLLFLGCIFFGLIWVMFFTMRSSEVYSAALRETPNIDAQPRTAYGNYNNTIKQIATDSNGYILANVEGQ